MTRTTNRSLARRAFSAVASAALVAGATGVFALTPPAAAQANKIAAQANKAAAQADTAGDIAQAVAALRAIGTMRADFIQTDANGGRLTGTLTMKRPGKIRFQYQPGVPLLIVSDGASLTMIDYEVRQVQRWPIRNSPLGALLDPDKDVVRFARLNPTGRPDLISMAVRDPGHPEYGTLTLLMLRKPSAPGGLELDSWIATDAQSRRTMVRLINPQYGVAVGDSMFRWTDPRQQSHRAG
ncbi:outer membrane lipoprotein carrier protein LolA [Novosphingobium sp. Fuku2-ISO-50]|uniref:LolA family protein n=1 Tax=Novosphingobium sp. Fuku2-ISO-50 TaxID=1739114 RepID=UPI00076CEC3D|nr:outer membrane lipoprotein carrier protein LolA [Novosphingobium sp. Fuku2-ISO-50]KUR76532.1 cell envelope biogenesis protein LolA [Novosphingobium sp. Fuku2-ISO-50]